MKRREFLAGGLAGAAVAATAVKATAIAGTPTPVDGDRGADILGPRNKPLERENPASLAPPVTDEGGTPNLKFSFDQAHNRLTKGGWAREVTVRQLPIATALAGVNMRLKAGAIRELHWHSAAEWAIMLSGRARITVIDPEGRNFVDDVGVGELWNFPAGFPHSIQALDGGCEFVLVFDDGNFSENDTFLLTDWIVHTPLDVLAKNFSTSESAFSRIPPDIEESRYIFNAPVPGALSKDQVAGPAGPTPISYSFHTEAQVKPLTASGGQVRIIDSSVFPAATTIAAAIVDVQPGAVRELHWHPTADEWSYWIQGSGRMTAFTGKGDAATFDFQAGDVGYVPVAVGHYVENTGDVPIRFLELFKAPRYADLSLAQWLGLLPPELVADHLPLPKDVIASLPKNKPLVVAARS
jgi:oxalate decarboxylase